MSKLPALLLCAAALALGLAACGGSNSSSSSGGGSSSSAAGTSSTAGATSSSAGSSGATSSSAAGGGGSGGLALAANSSGQLAYDKKTLAAKAGKVTITFTNASPLSHNLTIQRGTNGPVLGATPTFQGGSKTLTLTLKPGTYTFFCSVPGHRAAGMVGTLKVS